MFTFFDINTIDKARQNLKQIGIVFIIVGLFEICLCLAMAMPRDTLLILMLFGLMWIALGYVVKQYQSRLAAIILFLNCLYSVYFGVIYGDNEIISTVSLLIRCLLLLMSCRAVHASYVYYKLNIKNISE